MTDNVMDQEFLEFIVKSIVAHPEDVQIDRTVDERGVLLTLKINPADMGFVIGRQGQTARAIRTLLKIVGARNNARVNLKIYDPNRTEGSHYDGGMNHNHNHEMGQDDMDDLKI
jgi:hypothetical protein